MTNRGGGPLKGAEVCIVGRGTTVGRPLTLLLTRGFAAPVGLVVTYRSDDLHRRHPLYPTLGVWARLARWC